MSAPEEFAGPFMLIRDEITGRVPPDLPGNYRLGGKNGNFFYVKYTGRDDKSLQRRLLEHAAEQGKHTRFWFKLQPSALAAYAQECEDYHTLKDLDNEIHPDAPDGQASGCVHCAAATVLGNLGTAS